MIKTSFSTPPPSVLRGASIVGVATLASRILGFVRDLLVAKLFGAGMYADAFFVAFRIPNLLRSFVAEGALTAAFVPVFSSSLKEGQTVANQTLRSVLSLLLIITFILSALGIFFASNVVSTFAPGFVTSPEKFRLAVLLTQIMLPYICCVSLVAMINAALNCVHLFGAAAWAQIAMNATLICGAALAFAFDAFTASLLLAISVLLGGVIQVVMQIPALKRSGFSLIPSTHIFAHSNKELLQLMLPAMLGASIYQTSIFISTLLASLLREGSVSWLFYADRVAQFPMGIFSIAIASVLLPMLARAHAERDSSAFGKNLVNSLRYTSFIILPVSATIFVLAQPITALLFQRGAFSEQSTFQTARALQALCIGLWASSCHSMIARAFIARKDTVTPTVVGVLSLVVGAASGLLLMGPPEAGASDALSIFVRTTQADWAGVFGTSFGLGHVGLALGSSIASVVSLVVLGIIFASREERSLLRPYLIGTFKSAVAGALILSVVPQSMEYSSSIPIQIVLGISSAAALYGTTLFLLRSVELQEIYTLLKKRMSLR